MALAGRLRQAVGAARANVSAAGQVAHVRRRGWAVPSLARPQMAPTRPAAGSTGRRVRAERHLEAHRQRVGQRHPMIRRTVRATVQPRAALAKDLRRSWRAVEETAGAQPTRVAEAAAPRRSVALAHRVDAPPHRPRDEHRGNDVAVFGLPDAGAQSSEPPCGLRLRPAAGRPRPSALSLGLFGASWPQARAWRPQLEDW